MLRARSCRRLPSHSSAAAEPISVAVELLPIPEPKDKQRHESRVALILATADRQPLGTSTAAARQRLLAPAQVCPVTLNRHNRSRSYARVATQPRISTAW